MPPHDESVDVHYLIFIKYLDNDKSVDRRENTATSIETIILPTNSPIECKWLIHIVCNVTEFVNLKYFK